MEKNVIKVEFKECYWPHSVVRECVNMTREEVIEIYNLRSKDIAWYKFID